VSEDSHWQLLRPDSLGRIPSDTAVISHNIIACESPNTLQLDVSQRVGCRAFLLPLEWKLWVTFACTLVALPFLIWTVR
jgi:hypothetical protein